MPKSASSGNGLRLQQAIRVDASRPFIVAVLDDKDKAVSAALKLSVDLLLTRVKVKEHALLASHNTFPCHVTVL